MSGAASSDIQRRLEEAALLVLPAILFAVSGLAAIAALVFPASGLGGARAGSLGLAAVFLFTGIGHFAKAQEMSHMLPPWVPARLPIIWATGIVELLLAVGLARPATERTAGIATIAFLVLVFPVNVSAAMRRVHFGGHGRGPEYLVPRALLQLFLIGWAYFFPLSS